MLKIKAFLVAIMICASASQVVAGHWVHVRVDGIDDRDRVRINLPLGLIEGLLPLLGEDDRGWRRSDHRIRIGRHHHFTLSELREIWETVKAEKDFDLMTIEGRRDNLSMGIRGAALVVRSDGRSDCQIDMRIPTRVVDALLSGPGDELNLSAALDVMRQLGVGEFLSLESRDSKLRIWIDDQSGQ